MARIYVDQAALLAFLHELRARFQRSGRLYLVGETIQLYEGWLPWTPHLEYTAKVMPEDRAAILNAVASLQLEMDIEVAEESPADILPLPPGFENRARPADGGGQTKLGFYHFDPYSVCFRLITRGDEADYRAVLAFLERNWVTVEMMDRLLSDLLPRLNSETIAQDPAEFRRKYRGLLQMWRAAQPAS